MTQLVKTLAPKTDDLSSSLGPLGLMSTHAYCTHTNTHTLILKNLIKYYSDQNIPVMA